jgi:hypothetical protein
MTQVDLAWDGDGLYDKIPTLAHIAFYQFKSNGLQRDPCSYLLLSFMCRRYLRRPIESVL